MQQSFKMLSRRNGLQSLPRFFIVLVYLLLQTHSCKGQSQVIGPSQPIVAKVDDDIILPCHLEPAVDVVSFPLEWTRPDLNPTFVHMRRAGQDLIDTKHPSYMGRTYVSNDELKNGNVSLKLSKLKPSDVGRYKCYIPKLKTGAFVELVVGAASTPSISLSGLDQKKGGVVLQCESTGWYPEPEVFWLDGEGNLLSAGPTETVRGPDDLYTVSSRVTVEKRHSNSFTCRVQQNSTNQTRETLIHVPEDFFEVQSSSSSTTIILAVTLSVCIMVFLILGFYVWRQKKTKTKRSHREETDKGEKNQENEVLMTKEEQQKLKEEQQRREEAEKRVQILEEELQKKTRELQEEKKRREEAEGEVQRKNQELKKKTDQFTEEKKKLQDKNQELEQKLKEEKKKSERDQRELNDQLESSGAAPDQPSSSKEKDIKSSVVKNRFSLSSKKEQKKKKGYAEKVNLKKQLETEELNTKTKQIDDKQAEVKKLQEENQEMETNPQTMMEEQESNNEKTSNQENQEISASEEVILEEADPDGKFLRLKSGKNQLLANCKMEVNRSDMVYSFPKGFSLEAGKTVTIWASDAGGNHKPPTEVVWKDQKSWGATDKVLLILPTGEKKSLKL